MTDKQLRFWICVAMGLFVTGVLLLVLTFKFN